MDLGFPPSDATVSAPDSRSGLSLLIAPPNGAPYSMPIQQNWRIDIGRSPEALVCIDHPTVSRLHARIEVGREVVVRDLGSKNGTRVGGRRLAAQESCVCLPGELIEVGSVVLAMQRCTSGPVRCTRPTQSAPETELSQAKMSRLFALVERIAPDDVAVILIGETGVGKEVLAERIHERSSRKSGPFIRLHAAAVAASLFEAELFGHERGAFTGAHRSRAGLIEQAHRGTLFVDEVGELPADAQVKLLRVLEDGHVRRVGGDQDIEVDVRLIAATHRNLEKEVAEGRFRQDLYFRLNGFTLRIPPLRDRLEELPRLCEELLAEWAARRGTSPPRIGPETLRRLEDYSWPGNIRELRNVLRHAALLNDAPVLDPSSLPLGEMAVRESLMTPVAPSDAPESTTVATHERSPKVLDASELDEKHAIEKALAASAGNQSRAAKVLGISRRSLIRRLDKYDLARPRRGDA